MVNSDHVLRCAYIQVEWYNESVFLFNLEVFLIAKMSSLFIFILKFFIFASFRVLRVLRGFIKFFTTTQKSGVFILYLKCD